MNRTFRILLAGVAALIAIVIIGGIILNGTYYGRERVRRMALDAMRGLVQGEIVVGRIDGNLLDRFDLVDVSITDREGRPFLVAERIRARLSLSALLSKRIVIRSVELVRPVVTVSKVPGGEWNYEEIFAPTDTVKRTGGAGFGSWVDLHGLTIRNGTLNVHQPYVSDERVSQPVGDSAITSTLARETRLRVERVGYGLRQTMEFRDINARIPRLVWAHPDSTAIAFRVAELSMEATPLQAPDMVVKEFEGDVRIVEDSVTLRDVELKLPQSSIEGALTYHVSAGDVELDLKSDTLTFADIRTIYPELPDSGGGRLDLKATIRDTATSVYQFTNTRLRVGDTRIAGKLGMTVSSDNFALRETDLRLTRFTTQLVEDLVPGFRARIPGAFTGTAKVSGPPNAMKADVTGTVDPDRHAPFTITARGGLGAGAYTTAENLRITGRGVPVSLAREFVEDVPLGGTVNVDAVVSGSTASRFTGAATVRHYEGGNTSTLVAEGSVAPKDSMRMDLKVRLTPISLELVQRFNPARDLRGELRGTGEIKGTLSNLRSTMDLELPVGAIRLDGTFDVASAERRYQATVRLFGVDIQAVDPTLPQTALNGVATIDGRGTTFAAMDAAVTLRLRDFVFDSTRVAEAVAIASTRDGLLHVDSLRAQTSFGVVTANGTFGLIAGREGTLNYGVELTSVAGLQRWIDTRDTTVVRARPLARARAARRARLDSLRAAGDSTSIAAIVARRDATRRPPVRLPDVFVTDSIARDSLGGSLTVKGTLQGGVPRFSARGRADINHLVYDATEVGSGTVDFTWTDIRTPQGLLTAEAGVDSLRVSGFAFDSTHVKGTYRAGAGDVNLSIFPGDTAVYQLRARYALRTNEGEVMLQDVNLRFDSLTWRSTRESTISWKGLGLTIDSLELLSDSQTERGRIFVNGEVPDRDPGRLEIRIDNLRLAPWVTLLQSTVPVDGIASFAADIEGTRSAPRITGTVALREHNYRTIPFPEIHSRFNYADRRLQFTGDLRRSAGTALATLKGDLPIDLSMADSIVNRKLPGQVSIELEGDSIPLGPLAEFVEEFSVVTGEGRGKVAMRGTWERLRYEGDVTLNIPRLGLRTPGVTLTNTIVRAHMYEDALVIDSLVGHSGGVFRARGAILLGNFDRPVLDLDIVADETRVLDNYRGEVVVSSALALRGPVDTLAVGGTIDVVHGIIRIPDPEQFHLINTGDPTLFAVVDTALARALEIAPPSPILQNANVNVRLRVNRGTWARSSEANIEVYGDLAILRSTGDEDIQVTGALHSDYGDYELYGRRFSVARGSARFTGPMANPILQLTALHQVRQAGRAPFDIQVSIGGTLEQPNVSLSSQAQPTLTQSDLISFLAFGQSSTSLLQFEGSSVEGGGMSGSSLAGNVASLATRQLSSVALGALLTDLETNLSERTAFDVLNIRPADLPPGLSLGALGTVARGTQIEVGKYLDRNTFFVGQFRPTLAVPGATIERRFGTQWKLRTSLETRYHPLQPSLTSGLQPKMHQVIGALVRWTRSW
jgi:autotransporter translocation and assembly factor TamB